MYGMLTTGKPVKIISVPSPKKPAHYFEIQIDTRRNMPEIVNGKGDGEDIPAGEKVQKYIADHGIEWISHYPIPDEHSHHREVRSGTRVSHRTRTTVPAWTR
jgi:DNA topoisomerase-6 subunit B